MGVIPNCMYCRSSTSCIWCNDNYYLYNGACLLICTRPTLFTSEGFVTNGLGHCFPCSSINNCNSCDTSFGCTECQTGYFLNSTTGISSCELCNAALSNCTWCQNSSVCTRCDVNYKLQNGVCSSTCVSCLGGCTKCEGFNCDICLTCPTNTLLYNGSCVFSCPFDYYSSYDSNLNTSVCSECNSSCKSCNGPANDQCLSCSLPFYLQETSCVSACKTSKSYYTDSVNFLCLKCNETCKTCTGPNDTECTVFLKKIFFFPKIKLI